MTITTELLSKAIEEGYIDRLILEIKNMFNIDISKLVDAVKNGKDAWAYIPCDGDCCHCTLSSGRTSWCPNAWGCYEDEY